MKYVNGKDIFPEALLKQIQKYVSGAAVYIPAANEKRHGEKRLDTRDTFSNETAKSGINLKPAPV